MVLASAIAITSMSEKADAAITLEIIDFNTLSLTIEEGIYDGDAFDFTPGVLSGLTWGTVDTADPNNLSGTLPVIDFTFENTPVPDEYDGLLLSINTEGEVIGLNIAAVLGFPSGVDPVPIDGGSITYDFSFAANDDIQSLNDLDFSSFSGAAPLTTGEFTGISEFITVVPEPSSAVLLGVGALTMTMRRHRKGA